MSSGESPSSSSLQGKLLRSGQDAILRCESFGGNPCATLHWLKVDHHRQGSPRTTCHNLCHHLTDKNNDILANKYDQDKNIEPSLSSHPHHHQHNHYHHPHSTNWRTGRGSTQLTRRPPSTRPSMNTGHMNCHKCKECLNVHNLLDCSLGPLCLQLSLSFCWLVLRYKSLGSFFGGVSKCICLCRFVGQVMSPHHSDVSWVTTLSMVAFFSNDSDSAVS